MTAATTTPGATVATMARVAWLRTARSKSLWAGILLVALWVAATAIVASVTTKTSAILGVARLSGVMMVAVLPGLLVAAPISELLDQRSFTYLWSRPVSRVWLISALFVAQTPVVMLLLGLGGATATALGGVSTPWIAVGCAVGAVPACAFGTGLATLAPKQAPALAIGFLLLIDVPVGELPVQLRELTISHHTVSLCKNADVAQSVIGMTCISAVWLAVAAWRIRTRE